MELLHQSGEIIADKYRIIDILGQGSSGTTYKAENLQSGEKVAIKALSLHEVTDWKMLELFEREVKILSQLNHPGIPRYLEYFQVDTESDRYFYIVQQLAEGKSLAEWVESGWRTDEAGVRQIASQLLEILVYLHSLKPPVIHRDIKPQNIIMRSPLAPLNKGGKENQIAPLDKGGKENELAPLNKGGKENQIAPLDKGGKENELAPLIKGGWGDLFLVDFGAVSDTYYNTLVRGSTVVGTFGYMAPEQFKGQAVPTTDLYGLGATLLFLLTHRSPAELPTDNLKIDFRRVQISESFADWLEKILEPDVEDRFSSAKEALDVLSTKQVTYKNSGANLKPKLFNKFTIKAVFTMVGILALLFILPLDPSPEGMCRAIKNGQTITVFIYLALGGSPTAYYFYEVPTEDSDFIHKKRTLVDCAKDSNQDIVKLLFNAKDKYGNTPLHEVAKDNHFNDFHRNEDVEEAKYHNREVAALLIAKGADVNAKNKDGDTPLVLAIRYGNNEVVELLKSHGAKE